MGRLPNISDLFEKQYHFSLSHVSVSLNSRSFPFRQILSPSISPLLGHVLEGVGKALLAERQLADSPDLGVLQSNVSRQPWLRILHSGLTYRLQVLLDLGVQSTSLQSDDLGGSIGVVSNGGATLRAEDAVDGMARRALARPGLGGTVDGQSGLGDDGDQSYWMSAIGLCVAWKMVDAQ